MYQLLQAFQFYDRCTEMCYTTGRIKESAAKLVISILKRNVPSQSLTAAQHLPKPDGKNPVRREDHGMLCG